MTTLYQWKKTVSPQRAAGWLEKIAPFVPEERIAVVTLAGGHRQTLQAYFDENRDAANLMRRFGGSVSKVTDADWLPAPSSAPGKPLAFGRDLLVTGRPDELAALRAQYPDKQVLAIPAAMAFGTGEHATTAMCLRFLGELRKKQSLGEPWSLLDLGCGSAVLALAARHFGAKRAEGWDHDPHAVRTAKENVALNAVRHVKIRRVNLLHSQWPAGEPSGWPVVTANLFSELLISVLPRTAALLRRGGFLVASGVMVSQSAEVEHAFAACGLRLLVKRRRGRWLAYLLEKSPGVDPTARD